MRIKNRGGGVDRLQVPRTHPARPREPLHRDERRHVGRHEGRRREYVRQDLRMEQPRRVSTHYSAYIHTVHILLYVQ